MKIIINHPRLRAIITPSLIIHRKLFGVIIATSTLSPILGEVPCAPFNLSKIPEVKTIELCVLTANSSLSL